MERSALLPDFVIIGAQKAGSTALMRHLGAHPQVFVPDHEVRHFRDPWFQFGDVSVLEREVAGARPGQRRGIKCPDLLALPEAPGRVHDVLGDVQLLAVLREPVSRALSAYYYLVQFGFLPHEPAETGLAKILDGVTDPRYPRAPEVLEFGLYHRGLTRWVERFGREKLLVLVDADLRSLNSPAYAEVCAFLGVEPFTDDAGPSGSHNAGVYDLRRLAVLERRNRWLVRPFPGYEGRYIQGPDGLPAKLATGAITAFDRTVLQRVWGNTPPPVSAQLRQRLADFYRDDVAALSELLGRDLTDPETGWARKR